MTSIIEIIPSLKELDYISAKETLTKINSLRQSSRLSTFWSLCELILNRDSQIDEQEGVSRWLKSAIQDLIPSDCDPFVRSLFEYEIIDEFSEEISPYLKIIQAAPISDRIHDLKVPPFLENLNFRVGSQNLSGADVWRILLGDIKGLNFHWLLLFALYFWYKSDETDLVLAFNSFFNDKLLKENESDLVFLLLRWYCQNGCTSADVCAALDGVDSYMFMCIIDILLPEKKIKENRSLYVRMCVSELMKFDWIAAIKVLVQNEKDKYVHRFIAKYCVANVELTEDENILIEECKIAPETIWDLKVEKILYHRDLVETKREKLNVLKNAIDLMMRGESWERAHDTIFDLYVPLMIELGEGDGVVYSWCSDLLQHLSDPEKLTECRVMDYAGRVNKGEILNPYQIREIKRMLESEIGSHYLRKVLYSKLFRQLRC